MQSDIALAVGDGARRMTYAELADIRRTSVPSAMRLVRGKNWATAKLVMMALSASSSLCPQPATASSGAP